MMRRNTLRADDRAGSTILALALVLGLALGATPARAEDPPADQAKATGEAKAEEAKEQAQAAKEAGEAKAEAAKEAAETKKEAAEDKAEAAKDAGEAKAAEAKSKTKTKQKAAKAKAAKGGAVSEKTKAAGTMPVKPEVEPQRVQVQHILIAFAGSGTRATRPKEEAKKIAYEVLERARSGEDFDALVKQYTDDSPPGIYAMSGRGVAANAGEYPRDQMVAAFGNVGFAISPGNIGMADYDPTTSPFGWHIIKRLK